MSKRTVFTVVTPLSPSITRESILQTLHNHVEMIDLNPLVVDRFRIKAPGYATPEEYHCTWYQITDKITYVPGGAVKGRVTYNTSFHNLPYGLQTHCFAPLGLDIKGKWSIGGSLPGEPRENQELGLGIPKDGGLYLREDIDMRCNIFATAFVKKTLKKAHETLVARLVEKAHIREKTRVNKHLAVARISSQSGYSLSQSSGDSTVTLPSWPGSPGTSTYAAWQNNPELFYRNVWVANGGSMTPSLTPSHTGEPPEHPMSARHSPEPYMGFPPSGLSSPRPGHSSPHMGTLSPHSERNPSPEKEAIPSPKYTTDVKRAPSWWQRRHHPRAQIPKGPVEMAA